MTSLRFGRNVGERSLSDIALRHEGEGGADRCAAACLRVRTGRHEKPEAYSLGYAGERAREAQARSSSHQREGDACHFAVTEGDRNRRERSFRGGGGLAVQRPRSTVANPATLKPAWRSIS